MRSPITSLPSRAASLALPPSRTMPTAPLAAPPPPTMAAVFARYFSGLRGRSSSRKTKSSTATPHTRMVALRLLMTGLCSGRDRFDERVFASNAGCAGEWPGKENPPRQSVSVYWFAAANSAFVEASHCLTAASSLSSHSAPNLSVYHLRMPEDACWNCFFSSAVGT